MTDKKQPEALRLAELLTADEWPGHMTLVSYARECVAELRRLHAENTTLQQGYAAARLEIESLRADLRPGPGSYPVPQPAGEYPALPKPGHRGPEGTGSYFDSFTADQMRAYVDADRAMRAAQPAASPQPVVREPLPVIELMRIVMDVEQQHHFLRGTTNWASAVGRAVERAHGIKGVHQ